MDNSLENLHFKYWTSSNQALHNWTLCKIDFVSILQVKSPLKGLLVIQAALRWK